MYNPQKKTFNILPYRKLEELVQTQWPAKTDYSVIADNEWNNDCCYEETPELYDTDEEIAEWKVNGKMNISTSTILALLIEEGILPEGDYLITVCW